MQPKGGKKKGKGKGKGKAKKESAVIDGLSTEDMSKEQVCRHPTVTPILWQ